MNDYDKAARYAAKGDPAGFLRWLLPPRASLDFLGWLDTRTLARPGEADRTSDTIAELAGPSDPEARWALVVEFQSEPDPEILDRLLEYVARLRRELRHGPDRLGRYRVAAALVHLTGSRAPELLDMTLPGAPALGLRLRIISRALRDEPAAATLAEIAAGRATRWLLPWIPLMKGAGKTTMVEEWKLLAEAEPDRRTRSTFAVLALAFAPLTRHAALWRRGLERWNMKESPIFAEFRAEGRAEGRAEANQANILQILEVRFPGKVPAKLVDVVRSESDLATLSRWITYAITAASPAAFLASAGKGRAS